MAHLRKLAELPISAVPLYLLHFMTQYQKEVAYRLESFQENRRVSENDEMYIRKCSFWRKQAHRHAQKLFETENPDPKTVAIKITMNGMNTDRNYENPFPVLGTMELQTTGNTKYLFKFPYSIDEDSEHLNTQGWGSVELFLDPKKYKPSRLTPKCVFWYFPEEGLFAIYSFTY